MLSAILVIVGLSILVLIHELGHFIAAKNAGLLVEEFGFGFPPRMFSIKKGETRYSFNWLPFGGFVKIYGEHKHTLDEIEKTRGIKANPARSFAHQSLWRRFVIIGAGISINFAFGWLLLSLVFMIGARQAVVIADVATDSPAATAELLPGDEILNFKTMAEFTAFTNAYRGEEVALTIQRGEEVREVRVTPRVEPPAGQGALGVAIIESGFAKLGFFHSLWKGLEVSLISMAEIFKAFAVLIADIFSTAQVPDNVVGPVGIFGVASQLGSLGFIYVIQLIALISLNLAVLNFIPFPALDGGRLLFLLIEKIKGSPIGPTREFWANALSFGFLVLLMLVITVRDVARLF